MDSFSIAEWAVRLFTDRDRAASVMGDLIELESQKGALWFWLSVAGIVFSVAWRKPLAFIAALFAAFWIGSAFFSATLGVHAQHRPPWVPACFVLVLVGSVIGMIAAYFTIRYGLDDFVSQLALASLALIAAVIYLWWVPAVLITCMALSGCVVLVSIVNRKRRRAALIFLSAFAIGLVSYIPATFAHGVLLGTGWSIQVIGWTSVLITVLATWMTVTACSGMHRWLMRTQCVDSEIEGKSAA